MTPVRNLFNRYGQNNRPRCELLAGSHFAAAFSDLSWVPDAAFVEAVLGTGMCQSSLLPPRMISLSAAWKTVQASVVLAIPNDSKMTANPVKANGFIDMTWCPFPFVVDESGSEEIDQNLIGNGVIITLCLEYAASQIELRK